MICPKSMWSQAMVISTDDLTIIGSHNRFWQNFALDLVVFHLCVHSRPQRTLTLWHARFVRIDHVPTLWLYDCPTNVSQMMLHNCFSPVFFILALVTHVLRSVVVRGPCKIRVDAEDLQEKLERIWDGGQYHVLLERYILHQKPFASLSR